MLQRTERQKGEPPKECRACDGDGDIFVDAGRDTYYLTCPHCDGSGVNPEWEDWRDEQDRLQKLAEEEKDVELYPPSYGAELFKSGVKTINDWRDEQDRLQKLAEEEKDVELYPPSYGAELFKSGVKTINMDWWGQREFGKYGRFYAHIKRGGRVWFDVGGLGGWVDHWSQLTEFPPDRLFIVKEKSNVEDAGADQEARPPRPEAGGAGQGAANGR